MGGTYFFLRLDRLENLLSYLTGLVRMIDRHEPAADSRRCASRRAMLTGVGAIGLAGVLTACGGTDDAAATNPGTGPGSAGAPAPGGSPGAGPAGVLAVTTDIPVGGGKVVNGLLIVQPVAGTFKAYNAACPHQGVKVSAPKDGVASCPAHASTFAIADGARLSGLANRGLTAVPITIEGTDIVAG